MTEQDEKEMEAFVEAHDKKIEEHRLYHKTVKVDNLQRMREGHSRVVC